MIGLPPRQLNPTVWHGEAERCVFGRVCISPRTWCRIILLLGSKDSLNDTRPNGLLGVFFVRKSYTDVGSWLNFLLTNHWSVHLCFSHTLASSAEQSIMLLPKPKHSGPVFNFFFFFFANYIEMFWKGQHLSELMWWTMSGLCPYGEMERQDWSCVPCISVSEMKFRHQGAFLMK